MIFSNAAQYTFLDEKHTIGIDLSEKFLLKLSGVTKENKFYDSNWTSVICKVEVRFFFSPLFFKYYEKLKFNREREKKKKRKNLFI